MKRLGVPIECYFAHFLHHMIGTKVLECELVICMFDQGKLDKWLPFQVDRIAYFKVSVRMLAIDLLFLMMLSSGQLLLDQLSHNISFI